MKSDIDENLKMQRITKLLEKGGTMLATSHECGAPMFRYQGKVLCPVCDTEEGKKEEGEQAASGKPPVVRKESLVDASRIQRYGEIDVLIRKKVQAIAGGLENETDLSRIREKMECIELGIRLLKLMDDSR